MLCCVVLFAIYEYKDQNISSCFVWVWNLVSNIKGRTQTDGVWKQGTDEGIWVSGVE